MRSERAISKAYYKDQQLIFKTATETEAGLIALAQQWYPGIECTILLSALNPSR